MYKNKSKILVLDRDDTIIDIKSKIVHPLIVKIIEFYIKHFLLGIASKGCNGTNLKEAIQEDNACKILSEYGLKFGNNFAYAFLAVRFKIGLFNNEAHALVDAAFSYYNVLNMTEENKVKFKMTEEKIKQIKEEYEQKIKEYKNIKQDGILVITIPAGNSSVKLSFHVDDLLSQNVAKFVFGAQKLIGTFEILAGLGYRLSDESIEKFIKTLNLQYPESCSVKFFHEKDENFEIISSNDIIFADDNDGCLAGVNLLTDKVVKADLKGEYIPALLKVIASDPEIVAHNDFVKLISEVINYDIVSKEMMFFMDDPQNKMPILTNGTTGIVEVLSYLFKDENDISENFAKNILNYILIDVKKINENAQNFYRLNSKQLGLNEDKSFMPLMALCHFMRIKQYFRLALNSQNNIYLENLIKTIDKYIDNYNKTLENVITQGNEMDCYCLIATEKPTTIVPKEFISQYKAKQWRVAVNYGDYKDIQRMISQGVVPNYKSSIIFCQEIKAHNHLIAVVLERPDIMVKLNLNLAQAYQILAIADFYHKKIKNLGEKIASFEEKVVKLLEKQATNNCIDKPSELINIMMQNLSSDPKRLLKKLGQLMAIESYAFEIIKNPITFNLLDDKKETFLIYAFNTFKSVASFVKENPYRFWQVDLRKTKELVFFKQEEKVNSKTIKEEKVKAEPKKKYIAIFDPQKGFWFNLKDDEAAFYKQMQMRLQASLECYIQKDRSLIFWYKNDYGYGNLGCCAEYNSLSEIDLKCTRHSQTTLINYYFIYELDEETNQVLAIYDPFYVNSQNKNEQNQFFRIDITSLFLKNSKEKDEIFLALTYGFFQKLKNQEPNVYLDPFNKNNGSGTLVESVISWKPFYKQVFLFFKANLNNGIANEIFKHLQLEPKDDPRENKNSSNHLNSLN